MVARPPVDGSPAYAKLTEQFVVAADALGHQPAALRREELDVAVPGARRYEDQHPPGRVGNEPVEDAVQAANDLPSGGDALVRAHLGEPGSAAAPASPRMRATVSLN